MSCWELLLQLAEKSNDMNAQGCFFSDLVNYLSPLISIFRKSTLAAHILVISGDLNVTELENTVSANFLKTANSFTILKTKLAFRS